MFKTILITLGLIVLSHIGFAQNDTTIYYKANNKPAIGKEDAIRYISIKEQKENKFKISTFRKIEDKWTKSFHDKIASFENDSVIIIKSKIKDLCASRFTYRVFKKVGSGFHIKDYDKKGNLLNKGLSRTLLVPHWEGQVTSYYKSGKLEAINRYKNNQVLMNKNWLENGELYIENIFGDADVMPEFPGGTTSLMEYFSMNIKYPEEARKKSVEGRVFVSFVVDIDGEVIGAYIKKSKHSLLNQEALRVVSEMVNWSVGKLDGKPINVGYTVPINFRLQ